MLSTIIAVVYGKKSVAKKFLAEINRYQREAVLAKAPRIVVNENPIPNKPIYLFLFFALSYNLLKTKEAITESKVVADK